MHGRTAEWLGYPASVPDHPFRVDAASEGALRAALDREGKIDRALDSLGPIGARDIVAIDPGDERAARWTASGARLTTVGSIGDDGARTLGDGSADVVVSAWTGFRGVEPDELALVDRILRPDGRLLVVHDYGRDDISRFRGDQPEYGSWTRRDGPFLANGFRVRVIHCFWTCDDVSAARALAIAVFGAAAERLADEIRRPRLSWNVAVYHRSRGGRRPTGAASADQ